MTRRELMLALFPYGKFDYSLSNVKELEDVIRYDAYSDVRRNLHHIGSKDANHSKRDKVFKELAERMHDFFTEDAPAEKEKFKKWHVDVCNNLIIPSFKEVIDNEMTYGKAQKLVNMAFKHAFCFADAPEKMAHFHYCHIPVDGNVLAWYRKAIGEVDVQAWSAMDIDKYFEIQDNVREYLSLEQNRSLRDQDGTFTPLEADFFIWRMHNFSVATDNWIREYGNFRAIDAWGMCLSDDQLSQIKEIHKITGEIIHKTYQ